MAKIKTGDAVLITARELTPQDAKSGLYYAHYAGLRGTVLKLYANDEAAVNIDRDSLPAPVRARHEEGEKAMRGKWLDNLSEFARTGLNERERNFSLNYAVLVSVNDLAPDRGRKPAAPAAAPQPPAEAKAVGKAALALDPLTGESDVDHAAKNADGASESGTDSAVKRVTQAELDAQERAFLEQRSGAGQQPSRQRNGRDGNPNPR